MEAIVLHPSSQPTAAAARERRVSEDRRRDLRDAAIAVGLVVGVVIVDAAIDAAKRRAAAAVRRRIQRAIRKQAVKLLKVELKRAIDAL